MLIYLDLLLSLIWMQEHHEIVSANSERVKLIYWQRILRWQTGLVKNDAEISQFSVGGEEQGTWKTFSDFMSNIYSNL